jgi:light-harvesting protein B-800-850 alpha chain
MNQGRIWCVVKPTVGLPLLLGSVAITSLVVHASVMTHTTWMSSYWMGSKARAAALQAPSSAVATVAPGASPAFSLTVTPVPASEAAPASFRITVTPAGETAPTSTLAVDSAAAHAKVAAAATVN